MCFNFENLSYLD